MIRAFTVVDNYHLRDERQAAMAEWLRRVIRNHLGSSRVGSNPARSEYF